MALSSDMRGAALMTGAMAGFAISDACMKALGAHWPLFQSLFVRGCGTTLLLGGMAWSLGQLRPIGRRDAGLVLLRTLCEMAAAWLYLTAVMLMPLANVSAIHQAVPLTVTLAGAVVLGERVGQRSLLAILVGLGGVLLILQPGGEGFSWASLYVLGSVAAVTVRDIVSRMLSPNMSSLLVAAIGAVGVTMLGGAGAAFVDWQPPTARVVLLLVGTIAFVLLGYVASVSAMRVGKIAAVTPFRYTSLLVAVLLGAVLFGDVPDAITLAGAGIVVATGAYALGRDHQRPRPEEEASPGS